MADSGEFCRAHWAHLARCLATYVGDVSTGEDLAQEALARVVARWARVERMASPQAYAYRIGVNLAKDELRRRGRERRLSAQGPHAHQPQETIEMSMAVAGALSRLSPRQRLAVTLRYLADLSVADTARAMGCRRGTVKALCHQAVRSLRTSADLAWHASSTLRATED